MMRRLRTLGLTVTAAISAGSSTFAQAQQQFVPVQPGSAQESIPAAPLVFVAYGFVWVALATYVIVLWRRIGRVERELTDLNARLRPAKRS